MLANIENSERFVHVLRAAYQEFTVSIESGPRGHRRENEFIIARWDENEPINSGLEFPFFQIFESFGVAQGLAIELNKQTRIMVRGRRHEANGGNFDSCAAKSFQPYRTKKVLVTRVRCSCCNKPPSHRRIDGVTIEYVCEQHDTFYRQEEAREFLQ